jgi:hypothetical protein
VADVLGCKRFKRRLDQTRADAAAPPLASDASVVDVAAPPIVPAQHNAHNAVRGLRDKATARVSPQVSGNAFPTVVNVVKTHAFRLLPQGKNGVVILNFEWANRDIRPLKRLARVERRVLAECCYHVFSLLSVPPWRQFRKP